MVTGMDGVAVLAVPRLVGAGAAEEESVAMLAQMEAYLVAVVLAVVPPAATVVLAAAAADILKNLLPIRPRQPLRWGQGVPVEPQALKRVAMEVTGVLSSLFMRPLLPTRLAMTMQKCFRSAIRVLTLAISSRLTQVFQSR